MKKDPKTESFEDLEIWREGCDLAVEIYRNARAGELSKDYGLRDQITRAAVSIPANIAEGKERETVAELIRYLYIAKGSAGELRTHLHICYRIGYIDEGTCGRLIERTKILSKQLSGFIGTVRRGASAVR